MRATLTPRQLEVLRLAAEGYTARKTGTTLFIAEKTVKIHRGLIMRRLGAANFTAAVAIAIRLGLID